MSQKISKDRAFYFNAEHSVERCENCHFFIPSRSEGTPNLCELVDGDIHPDWTCDINRLRDQELHGQGQGKVLPADPPPPESGTDEFMTDNPQDILR